MIKKIFLLLGLFISFVFANSEDGKVYKIYAHYENAKSSSYNANNNSYFWGQGKNLVIDGFEYNGHRYKYISESSNVKIRRSDNSNASGKPCGLFAEKNNDAYHLKATFPEDCNMAKVMAGRIINIGALDLFKNSGYTAKNIERVDFISPNGITAPSNSSDLSKAGHVVTEKSGNNELKIAAILSLDANGNPSSYGKLVDIHGHTGNKDYGITKIYLPSGSTIDKEYFGFYANEKNSPQGNPWHITDSHEALGMCFVSLKDLGINAGQKYYGFSYFGRDVTNSMNLVDYNSFPKDTGGDTADPYGGVASYFADETLPKPFQCTDQAFIGIDKYNNDTTYMSDISVVDEKVTVNAPFKKIQNTTDAIYSFGYNPKDNYIWGYNNVNGKIEKVDANYKVVASYDISGLPKNNYSGADVDKNGILYLYQSKHSDYIRRIDLNQVPPRRLTPIKLNQRFSTSDIAINPVDGLIYFIPHDTGEVWYISINGTNGTLHKIENDFLTKYIEPSKRDGGIWANATFFDAEGSMYVNSYRKHPGFYLYKIDIRDKKVVGAKRLDTKIQDDLYQADGARCALASGGSKTPKTTDGICYAISDTKNEIYKVYMDPGANPLPLATKIDITGINDRIDGEGGAYNSADGKIYAFHESSSGPKLYSIDPDNGRASYIKKFADIKRNITGASFYGGYFYVIAKTHDGDATLYKIKADDWSIKSTTDLNGDTTDADALAINTNGKAYIITDNNKKIYKIDINSATTTYVTHISTNTDAEALSFAKDGNLYVENSENNTFSDTDKLFKVDLSTGKLTAAAQIPHSDDIDIEGLSCNVIVPENSIETEYSFPEGNDATRNKIITIKIPFPKTLKDSDFSKSCHSAKVHYQTKDGTAVDSKEKAPGKSENCPCKKADYFESHGDITVKTGDSYIEIPVQISEDGFFEMDEDFKIDITVDDDKLSFLNTTITVVLKNDDKLKVGFYTNKQGEVRFDAFESDKNMFFKLGLNSIVPKGYGDVVVRYKTVAIPHEATPNVDYKSISNGYVVFKEGDVDKILSIPLMDDKIEEGVETFKVVLTDVENAKASIYQPEKEATGYIQDDDYGNGSSTGYKIHDNNTIKIFTKSTNGSYNIIVDADSGFSIPFEKIYYSCSDCYTPTCRESSRKTGKRYQGVDENGHDIYSNNNSSNHHHNNHHNSNHHNHSGLISNLFSKAPKFIATDSKLQLSCSSGCGSSSGSSSCSSCSPPCSYWSSVGYVYSYNMTVSKATLMGYKKYNPTTNQCEDLIDNIPLDVSSIKDIQSGGTKTFTFKPTKAYRCAKIKIEGKSDTDYTQNTGTSKTFISYSDLFAIRPDRFVITADENNNTTGATSFQYSNTNPLIAGNQMKFNIKAVGSDGKDIAGYDEDITKVFSIKDAKYPTVTPFGFNYSGKFAIANSTFKADTTYLEAGDLTITLKEDPNNPFALVDKNDGTSTSQLLIPTLIKRFRVVPDHFDISYTVNNQNNSSDLTFIANDLTTMSSNIDMTIKAENSKKGTMTRYEKAGYADTTDLTITNHIKTQNTQNPDIYFTRVSANKNKNSSIDKAGSSLDTTFTIKSDEFTGGIFKDKININFKRVANQPLEPIQLFTDKLYLKEKNGVGGVLVDGTKDNTASAPSVKYYYARAHAPSPQSVAGNVLDSKIYYEVYCQSCDKSIFTLAKAQASIDSVYWYILPRSSFSTLLTNSTNNFTFKRFADNSNIKSSNYKASTNDFEIYNIAIKKAPDSNRVYYTSSPYLLFDKYNTSVSEHNYNIKFSTKSKKWAGKGNKGATVDTNISQIPNQSIDW